MGDSYKNTGAFTPLATAAPLDKDNKPTYLIPGATPKYAKQDQPGGRTDGYKDTMARLYLYFKEAGKASKLTEYLNSLTDERLKTQLAEKIYNKNPQKPNTGYIEFLLQSATHKFEEKIDVVETLADKYVAYAYGSSHPVFYYQIAMLNSKQDDQAANMYRLYWHVLRATRLANAEAEVYFEYDRMIVCGAMRNFSWSLQANDESYCQGSFEILVRKVLFLPDEINKSTYDNDAAALTTGPSVMTGNFESVVANTGAATALTIRAGQ